MLSFWRFGLTAERKTVFVLLVFVFPHVSELRLERLFSSGGDLIRGSCRFAGESQELERELSGASLVAHDRAFYTVTCYIEGHRITVDNPIDPCLDRKFGHVLG